MMHRTSITLFLIFSCFPPSYLELADWDLKEALQSAKEDREWEKEEAQNDELKSGQIGVSIRYKGGKPLVDLKGIGKSNKDTLPKVSNETPMNDHIPEKTITKQKVIVYSAPPAIATKSVRAEDLFNVSTQL